MIDRVNNSNAAGWPQPVQGASEGRPAQGRFSMRADAASIGAAAAPGNEHAADTAASAESASLSDQLTAEFGSAPTWLVESVRTALADDPNLAEFALYAGVPLAPPEA